MLRLFGWMNAERELSQRRAWRALREIGLLRLASQEAKRWNHEYVGSELVLLALLRGGGAGAQVLAGAGVSFERVRTAIAELVRPGPEMVIVGHPPVTPAVARILKVAAERARTRNAAPDELDLLVGLLGEEKAVAVQVLDRVGLDRAALRERLALRD